jgi:DinB superfamily
MNDTQDDSLRQQIIDLLRGGNAHAKFDQVIAGIPAKMRGRKAPGLPHSPWMLIEHIRIAQWDILEFSRNRKHASPKWPEGYWPKSEAPASATAWTNSIKKIRQELKAMESLVKNSKTDLFAKIPWGDGQTILRQALLIADHNAYHLAQLVDVRRVLGIWPEK